MNVNLQIVQTKKWLRESFTKIFAKHIQKTFQTHLTRQAPSKEKIFRGNSVIKDRSTFLKLGNNRQKNEANSFKNIIESLFEW